MSDTSKSLTTTDSDSVDDAWWSAVKFVMVCCFFLFMGLFIAYCGLSVELSDPAGALGYVLFTVSMTVFALIVMLPIMIVKAAEKINTFLKLK